MDQYTEQLIPYTTREKERDPVSAEGKAKKNMAINKAMS